MLNLDDWQKEFINTSGDKILCCGRQVGKSVVCSIDAGEWAIKNGKKNVLMIAPTERQAYELYFKTLEYLTYKYPNKIITKGKDKPTKTKFKLTNGTKVYCLPTGLSGLGVRFLTIGRLYADESSRIAKDVWAAVTPMLVTTGGDTILLSSPAETDGYFYDCWINRNNAFNSFKRFSISTLECLSQRPISETWTQLQRDKAIDYIKNEKLKMTAREFAQEYEGKFNESIKRFFSEELLKQTLTINKSEAKPLLRGKNFLGVDVAGMGKDDSVLITLNETEYKRLTQTSLTILNKVHIPQQLRIIEYENKQHRYNKMFVDDGGLGFGLFGLMLESDDLKRKTIALNNSSRSLSNKKNGQKKRILKEDLYNHLLCLMEQDKIKLFNDDEIYRSLRSIQAIEEKGTLRIYGNYSHIAEAIIRAAWGIKEQSLNIFIHSR